MTRLLNSKSGQIIVSVPLALYFILLIAYISPRNEARDRLVQSYELWWDYWRLDQNWALFSPGIRDINYHPSAVVSFEDGTEMAYPFPRNSKDGLMGELSGEKWRKLSIDSLPWPDFKPFWPDVARFIGRQCYAPSNKPVSMSLYLHWTDIPKPEVHCSREKFPYQTKFQTVFVYRYKPGDFL